MATDKENTPQRRIEDKHPAEKIDWSQPEAPTVPMSITAGAAKGGNTSDNGSSNVAAPASQAQAAPILVPKWAGQFHSYQEWVNKAQTRLASPDHRRAMCVDAKGRRCAIGADFMLARDEGAFPVRYFWECELVAAPAVIDQPTAAGVPDIVREAVEAAFEDRAGWRVKIAAAVRALASKEAAPADVPSQQGGAK